MTPCRTDNFPSAIIKVGPYHSISELSARRPNRARWFPQVNLMSLIGPSSLFRFTNVSPAKRGWVGNVCVNRCRVLLHCYLFQTLPNQPGVVSETRGARFFRACAASRVLDGIAYPDHVFRSYGFGAWIWITIMSFPHFLGKGKPLMQAPLSVSKDLRAPFKTDSFVPYR